MSRAIAFAVGMTLALPALALGQPKPAKPAPKAAAKEEAKEEKAPDRWLAVHAGQVHTVTGPVLRDVTILAKNGSIAAIGSGLALPEGTEEVDARAYRVYPGLVAFDSGGIVGPVPEDSTDVYGLSMTLALSAGITTVGAGGKVCKLTYGTLEGHVIGARSFVSLDMSSARARRQLREALAQARDYLRKKGAAERAKARGEKVEVPKPPKGRVGSLLPLLAGDRMALARARTSRQLREVAELALLYGFRGVVEGGEEAWTVASLLGRAGWSVVVVPRARRGEDDRLNRASGWTIENAARLHAAGVPVALMSRSKGVSTGGLAGRDLFTLPLEGAFAVRGGLSEEAALAALTIAPARLLGVDDQVGSIEVGKACDLVIAAGDLLHYGTLPEWTIVNGRIAYDKEQESLLRAVRSRAKDGENVELPQLWPRTGPEPGMPEGERD
jgi:hypothetical protein